MADQRIHNTKKELKLGYQFTLSRQAILLVLPPLSSISNFQGLSTIPWSALKLAVPPNPTNISLVTQSGPRVSGDQTQRVGKSPRFQMDSLFETQPARTHTTILASFFAKRTASTRTSCESMGCFVVNWGFSKIMVHPLNGSQASISSRCKLTTNSTTLQVAKFQEMMHFLCRTLCNSDLAQRCVNYVYGFIHLMNLTTASNGPVVPHQTKDLER